MSTRENMFQWMAISMTALGLVSTTYYNAEIVKAAKLDSELASFLNLNDRYNTLVFKLINSDSEVFQKTDAISLDKNRYLMYELFELIATIKSLESVSEDLTKDVWGLWERKIEFLLSKPALQFAWQKRRPYAEEIYDPSFVAYIDRQTCYSN